MTDSIFILYYYFTWTHPPSPSTSVSISERGRTLLYVFRIPLFFDLFYFLSTSPPEVDHCITVLGFWILIIIIIITLAVAVLLFSIRADFSSPYFFLFFLFFLFYIAVIYIDLKKRVLSEL
jgi:hypothetical protein